MDRRAFDDRRRIGTVKAAINLYGERILEGSASLKKPQMDLTESSSTARELHMAKRDVVRYKENRMAAQSVKVQAESELSNAKKTVKDLAFQIEESTSKAKARMRDMETLKKSGKREDKALRDRSFESHRYAEMMRELEHVKQELSKLKLDMASVLEEKKRAEKEIEGSSSKLTSDLSSAEALRKEIEEVNDEQVLVELAGIEALKEFGEIEAQRQKEANEFSFEMEKTRHRMKDVIEEIDHSKELESKLAVTLSDVNVLQNELKLVKEIEKKVLKNDSLKHSGGSFRETEKLGDSTSLRSVTEELGAAKKELASIREEGFQFMSSMDIIRNELKHVREETSMLKKTEEKADLTVQNLNSKLLRAKSKLEVVSAAEEKAKSIVSNLSLTLEQLKTEADVAKKEKELISTETANIKAEIQKTESEIDKTKERLQTTMQELKAAKLSEALALENLQNLIENTMRARASACQQSSSITISKFEYEYLTGRAVRAEEIADKKVAAAQAWVEALKANEKEILMKIEIARREIRETRVEEEQQVYRTERSLSAKRAVEGEIRNWRHKREKNTQAENLERPLQRKSMKSNNNSTPRKSMKGNDNWTPSKRGKVRNSASPAVRTTPGSTSFIIRKKKKVMPNLAKFFSGKKIGKHP
ncbi:protein PLASTID MOVEMENT IMPAIRED 2-like isoform X2 [Hevea brasiliensis]|uniref:protein PLASTID MOVEMENT IMPAIRED 2 isoform X2 n=1 Tax=Hevea brasiliensis TaxID=3981 RepID=UPI0025E317F8|nr:protein PLASTID MOVEMENT IMPAIRED 2 isoform X2 [Hevea brasiliensis]XP_057993492.1 protein PLASTID MOVEMENT IMPAIRED 2-like isoform X2 [Hevea brasiliensis]